MVFYLFGEARIVDKCASFYIVDGGADTVFEFVDLCFFKVLMRNRMPNVLR